MAYGMVAYNSNDRTVTVSYRDLGHSGSSYAQFSITIGGRTFYSRNYPSENPRNEANLIYNIESIPNGLYDVELHAKTDKWYPIYDVRFADGGNQLRVYGGGSQPQVHPMTNIELLEIISAEEDLVKIKIRINGYGDLALLSVTKGWNLYDGSRGPYVYINELNFEENEITDGTWEGNVTFYPDKTDLSYFPSVPIGTCYLASGGGITHSSYNVFSKPFLCMSEYKNWSIYDGTYRTTLRKYNYGLSANVLSLSTVKDDWNRLVNMSFYLESTVYGTIKYTQYANYIPRSGDIITADMYNSLLDAVYRCCGQLNMPTDRLPGYVRSNEIISKYFIYKIGQVIDDCLFKQRQITNYAAIR